MRKIASHGLLLIRLSWSNASIRVILGGYLIYLFLGVLPVHALDPDKRISQYIHTSWRTEDGSAPAGMYTVAQTSDGFLWFSAFSQLMYRFDGVRFVPLLSPPRGSSTHKVFEVFGDHAGGLWAEGNHEIVHLRGGVVSSEFELEGLSSFQNMSEDPDGSLWVVRAANTVSDAPLCHITERAVKCFGKADGIPIVPIDSILADGKGGFWLGGQTALVHWHDGVSETYPIAALKSNIGQHGIVSLALGPDGSLWVGILAEGPGLGLGQLKHGAVQPFVTPTFDGSKVEVHETIFDRDGNLWVATAGKGIFRIHGNFVDHYGRTDGLSSNSVFGLFEDREGIMWAATTNGIDSFRDPRVATFSASEGLGKDAAVGVLASRDGSIWVANDGSLDHIANGAVSSIRTGSGLPGHQVASLLEDSAGKLWVGVDDGLYLFENGRFRRLPEPNNRPLGMVVALTEDIDGNVWAECAGNPRRLVRIRNFQVREEFPAPQIPAGRTLAADPQGGIWIGTTKGDLALFRHGVLEKFPLNPKGDPVSRRILARADGSVLAATEDGLVELRQGKLQRLTRENGLPCNSVISFVEDKEKRWWFYMDCGVLEMPDSELEQWWSNPKTMVQARLYDQFDGAQPNAPYFNSGAYSQDGRVWFANGTAVQMVDPSRLSQKALPALTYIESVIVDRKEFAVTDNLKLPPHPRDLQIDYTSPTFLIPQRVKFRYRLDPYDRDWKDAGTRRQAFYTDLSPGNYSFRVIASNSDGIWNSDAAKLDFSIAPAYYQANWFRALCAAAFLALLWVVYLLRVRHLQKQFDMTLDARVGERVRIARELHDTLLQSFHGILLHLQTVSNELSGGQTKQKLDNVIGQAAQAIIEGRDAVQGLRASTMESNDLALAIKTVGEELAASESSPPRAHFTVQVEGTARDLHPILRDEIYRITGEGIRNAFRHADAQRIEVEIHYDERQLRVRMRDDGKGIDPKLLGDDGRQGHFGLRGMRERAKLIGGKLTLWSEMDAGTEVELSIPAARAYTPPSEGQPMRLTDKIFAKLSGRGTAKKS